MVQVIGEREKDFMKKKITTKKTIYEDIPLNGEIINDFLPSPKELAFKEETVKVTIALSKQSLEYFKNQGSKYHTPYQKMIRRLLDEYATVNK